MKLKKTLLSALAVTTTLALVGCGTSGNQAASSEATSTSKAQDLKIAYTVEPSSLDPSKASDEESFDMINMFGEGLYRLDQKRQPIPAIAASMPEISKDGKTYTIHLRGDAKWADGSAVTAQDFEYSWKRTLDPKTKSEYAFMLNNWIKGAEDYNTGKAKTADNVGVKALDAQTLQIQLNNPTAVFTRELAFQVFFPEKKSFVEQQGDKFGGDSGKVLSNGPFVLKSWTHDQSLTFEKNPNYWDAKSVKLNSVTFQIVQDANTAMNLYQSGNVDLTEINRDQVAQWKDKPDYLFVPKLFTYYLMFNEQKIPAFKNTKIRQALTMAVDRQAFVDTVLGNGSKPATGLVPLGMSDGNNGQFRQTAGNTEPASNVDEAKKLLAEGLKEVGLTQLPKFTMIADDDDIAKKSLEVIQAQLKQNLGVETDIQNLPKKLRSQKMSQMDYDVIAPSRWGADYDDPTTYLDMWVTGSDFNNVGYSNPEYDKLVKAAHTETDTAKRTQELVDAEKILMKDMPIGPLYYLGRTYLKRPNIDGLVLEHGLELKWASVK